MKERETLRIVIADREQLQAEKELLEDKKRILEQTLVRANAFFGI